MARLLLRDLTPGTNYKIQLRAVDGDSVSEWSRLFDLPTTTDVTPPDVPAWAASNEWVVDGDTFVATWQALNFTLDQNKDFDHYEIEIGNGVTFIVLSTNNVSYTLTYDQNRIFFGDAEAEVSARVRSVDAVGNASAWSALKNATNPAPGPVSSISVTSLYDAIDVKWDAGTLPEDFKGFVLQVSTTSSSSGFSTIYTGPNSQFQHASTMFTTDHWFRVYVQDKFDTLSSAVTSSAIKPKSTFALDSVPPAAPTSLSYTQGWDSTLQAARIDVSWTASVDTDVERYEVRWSATAGSNWRYRSVGHDITSTRIDNLLSGVAYYVDVRAVDFSGNVSSWVNQSANYPITTNFDSTAPSTPSTPTAAVGVQKIQVVHDGLKSGGGALELDTVALEVYASTTSGFTTYDSTTMLGTIQFGPANIETFNIPASAGSGSSQTWYVKVIAVDRAGNKSPASAQATASVGLIATANISDLAVTNAKINDLAVTKLTAGTINTGDINVESKFILGTASSDGVMESYDYGTSGGTTGFSLDSDGLIIKTGTIEAAALKLQLGANLGHPKFVDFEFQPTSYPNPFPTSAAVTSAAVDTAQKKFGGSSLKIVHAQGASRTVFLGETSTDYNMNLEASQKYVLSAYLYNASGASVSGSLGIKFDDASSVTGGITITNTAAWVRYSVIITSPAAITKGLFQFAMNDGTIYVDGVQVEKAVNDIITSPSTWSAPGSTNISGGSITTGSIRSNTDLIINGVTLPTWAIDLTGDAQFGDVLIRGTAIVGSHEDEAEDSYIKSFNYSDIGDGSGWIIRSDGVAEFRQVTAGTFNGEALKANTVSVDVLTSSSLTKRILLGEGASLSAEGPLGEEVSLSSLGFRVFGPDEVAITNKTASSGAATLETALEHGYQVGQSVIVEGVDSDFNSPLGTTWTITAIPTTTSFTYTFAGPDTTSVAATGLARGKDTTGRNLGPKYIDFPTDGTQPNIISGTLTADTLLITDTASIFGTNSLENGAVMTIASAVLPPASAPVVTVGYNDKTLTGIKHSTGRGIVKGHDGHYYVLSKVTNKYAVTKHDSATGALLSTPVDFSNTSTVYYTAHGLAFSSTYNKYYLLYDYNNRASGNFNIAVYDTSFTLTSTFTVNTWATLDWDSTALALGWDHVNDALLLAFWDNATEDLKARRYTMNGSGVPTGTAATTTVVAAADAPDPAFISYGAFDLGANYYVYRDRIYSSTYAYKKQFYVADSSAVAKADLHWPGAYNTTCWGAYWNSTASKFYDLGSTKVVREYNGADSFNGIAWSVSTVARSGSTATLVTTVAHDFVVGDQVVVAGTTADSGSFNGTFEITDVPNTTTFTYTDAGSAVSTTASGGGTATGKTNNRYIAYTWYDPNTSNSTHETTLSPAATVNSFPKRATMNVTIASIPGKGGTGLDSPNQARIYVAHDTAVPAAGAGSSYRLRSTLTYPSTSAYITPTLSVGTTVPPTTNGFGGLVGSAAEVRTTSGNSFWKGDDTAQFYQLVLTSGSDVNATANNKPALRVGGAADANGIVQGSHARFDANEIQAMADNSTPGFFGINLGGGNVTIGNGGGNVVIAAGGGTVKVGQNSRVIRALDFGQVVQNTDANSRIQVNHDLGITPNTVVATSRNNHTVRVFGSGSSQFTLELRLTSTGALVGSGVSCTVDWFAIAA